MKEHSKFPTPYRPCCKTQETKLYTFPCVCNALNTYQIQLRRPLEALLLTDCTVKNVTDCNLAQEGQIRKAKIWWTVTVERIPFRRRIALAIQCAK